MDHEANPAAGNPLLIECDAKGLIRSMSDAARDVFGPAAHLVDALRSVAPAGRNGLLRLASAARFSPVFQQGDSLWISAELADRAVLTACATAALEDSGLLLDMQSGLLRRYFRLQDAERQLSTRTRGLRRATPAQTLLQIERERERLGIELHTGVGQTLAAIRLQLEIIASQLADAPAAVKQALSRISILATEALDYVRSVSKRLHPPEWQRLTLGAALAQLWEMSGVPERYQGSIEIDALVHEPAHEIKVLMYRAAQEALSNLRHSRAARVSISLRQSGETLVLTIEDNGVGFDPHQLFSAAPSVAAGLGLRSVREQAALLGGGLIVQSGPNGTKLEVIAPFA